LLPDGPSYWSLRTPTASYPSTAQLHGLELVDHRIVSASITVARPTIDLDGKRFRYGDLPSRAQTLTLLDLPNLSGVRADRQQVAFASGEARNLRVIDRSSFYVRVYGQSKSASLAPRDEIQVNVEPSASSLYLEPGRGPSISVSIAR
jgi:hypothetical protein